MLRKKYLASLAVAGVASLTLISVAHADGYEPAGKAMAAPVAAYAWGGLYVGVGIGGAQFDNSVGVDASKTTEKQKTWRNCYDHHPHSQGLFRCTPWSDWDNYRGPYEKHKSAQFGDDSWDVFGTLQIGYDHMLGNRFLIGAFADFDFFPQSDDSFSAPWLKHYDGESYEVGSFDGNINLKNIWSVGGRAGFLIAPRWLIYGGGGYSEAKLDGSMNVTFDNHYGDPTVLSVNAPDDLQGYFLEGGTEFKVHRNVSLKLAYRYTDLDGAGGSTSAGYASDPYCTQREWHQGHSRCEVAKRWLKDFKEKASFDAEIHSIRATLVIGLNPVPQALVPLK